MSSNIDWSAPCFAPTGPGKYRLRDGEVVEIRETTANERRAYGHAWANAEHTWRSNGQFLWSDTSRKDIIAPVKDTDWNYPGEGWEFVTEGEATRDMQVRFKDCGWSAVNASCGHGIPRLIRQGYQFRRRKPQGCLCNGCGVRYRGDLIVPDDVWDRISNGQELLCPTCILNRAIDRGVWTAARGTDVDHPALTEQQACEIVTRMAREGRLLRNTLGFGWCEANCDRQYRLKSTLAPLPIPSDASDAEKARYAEVAKGFGREVAK